MVAASIFPEGAVLISDSRASYEFPNKLIPNDALQKILPIGRIRIFSYAGSVSMANKAMTELSRLNKLKREYQYLDGIIQKLPGLLKTVYKSSSTPEKRGGLSVIVGGKLLSGKIKFWVMNGPNFYPNEITSHKVIGSGEVVKDYLDKEIANIQQKHGLKAKADALIMGLSGELSRYGIESVGGMFQVVLVSPDGVVALDHGYIDLNPLQPPSSGYMHMEKGQWIQHNLAKGEKTPVLNPSALLCENAREKRVLDYIPLSESKKKPHWHLNYFITSLGVKIVPGDLSFHHPVVVQGSHNFPLKAGMYASIGFWGTSIDEHINLVLEKNGVRSRICQIPFKIAYFPEDIDIQIELNLNIEKPGLVFLEAWVSDQLLARRALYFMMVEADEPKNEKEKQSLGKEVRHQLREQLIAQEDPVVERGQPQLVYFTLCQEFTVEKNIETFHSQFWVTYWKKYPLPLRCLIASAFRLSKGKHQIKFVLVDAASGKVMNIFSTEVQSQSSCLITPVHVETIINIPEPGYYYVNAYVDTEMTATTVLIAETDQPRFSYSLLPEMEKEIQDGQLRSLVKRSSQKQ